MRPVDAKYPISQPFGSGATAGVDPYGDHPMAVYVRMYGDYQPYGHAGMDIATPVGTPVYAMAAGTVLWADWGTNLPGDDSGAGWASRWYLYKGFPGIVTVIQHPWGKGIYAHLSSNDAAPAGTKVTEGQLIGYTGDTGGVAPHLHVEALVNDSYVTQGNLIYGRTNPAPFFGSTTPIETQAAATTPKDWTDMFSSLKDFKEAVAESVWGVLEGPRGKEAIQKAVWGFDGGKRNGKQVSVWRDTVDTNTLGRQLIADVAALKEIVRQQAAGEPVDYVKVQAAVEAGLEAKVEKIVHSQEVTTTEIELKKAAV